MQILTESSMRKVLYKSRTYGTTKIYFLCPYYKIIDRKIRILYIMVSKHYGDSMTKQEFFTCANQIIKNHTGIEGNTKRAEEWESLLTPLSTQKFMYPLDYLAGSSDRPSHQQIAQALGIIGEGTIRMNGTDIVPEVGLREVCRRISYIHEEYVEVDE